MRKNNVNLENDFLDFIKLCNQHQVKYLVIGGYAVIIHGYPRSTKGMDICIQLSEDNALKMLTVVKDFSSESLKLTKADFLKEHYIIRLGYEPLRIDIINDLDGVSFDIAWKNRKEVKIMDVPIHFIGYHELLIVKQKARRPQDLADINKLKKRNNIK